MRLRKAILSKKYSYLSSVFLSFQETKKCMLGLAYVHSCKRHLELLGWQTGRSQKKNVIREIGLWFACGKMVWYANTKSRFFFQNFPKVSFIIRYQNEFW